jgi:hypothetical protein
LIQDDHDLLKILKEEESDASTYYSSQLAQSQAEAMDRYHARPYGDEVDGRSKVVTHDIEDTINWIMPALMRTFEPSDDLITCDDDSIDDGSDLLTATAQYLRHVFFNHAGGEDIIHDFIFDGLLQKVGIIRTGWEPPRPSPPIIRDGVTADQLLRYHNDPQYQILEISSDGDGEAAGSMPQPMDGDERPPAQPQLPALADHGEAPQPGLMAQPQPSPAQGLMAGAQQSPMAPGQPAPMQPGQQMPPELGGIAFGQTFAVKLQKVPRSGKPIVETIQPEQFLISSRAKSIEEAPYHGARFEMFMADVISMYPERAYLLDPNGDYLRPNDEEELNSDTRMLARFPDEPDTGRHAHDDEYREKCWLKIEYLHCDWDRDDIVELRRIVRVGDVVLENDIAEESEFTIWSPLRVSHRAIGRSLADTLIDIQKIRTVITRKTMDALSQSLTPRTFYNKRTATSDPTFVDQLLDHDVGSAIGVDGNPNEQILVQVTPDVSGPAFQAIEYWDRRSEEASGVNRHAMGIQPQAITDTARGIDSLQSAANSRVEQVARHVGKSLSVALGKLLRVIVRHQHTPQIFKVSGKRVQWDARQVSDDMTVAVHVGMTAESREKRFAFLGSVLAAQKEILMQMGPSNPIVSLKHLRHTLGQMVTVGGYRDATPFFSEVPSDWQPQPPGPDAKTAEVQAKQQMAQAEFQAGQQKAAAELQQKSQIAQLELQGKTQLQTAEFQQRIKIEEAKAAREAETAAKRFEMDREIAILNIEAQRQAAQEKAALETQLARERMAEEMALARERIMQERELALERMMLGSKSIPDASGSEFRPGGALDA